MPAKNASAGRQDVGTIAAQGNTIQQKMLLLWQAGAGTDAAGSTAIQQNLLGIRL